MRLIFLLMFYTVLLSFNVAAAEDSRPSLFNDISNFLSSILQSGLSDEAKPKNNVFQLIELERLEVIFSQSHCIDNLPKNSAIKLSVSEDDNENIFLISDGPKVINYADEKFDIFASLSLNDVLNLENSLDIDGDLLKLINSDNLKFEYNFLKALKYRNVLSCIQSVETEELELPEEIIIPEEEIEESEIIEEPILEIPKVTLIDKNNLEPQELKFLFGDFENYVPYTVVSEDIDEYSNIRAIKILENWNYAVQKVNYDSLVDGSEISDKNIILMGYSCDNKVTSHLLEEAECKEKVDSKKGIIEFYAENSRNVLLLIGNTNQDLVDSVSILSNHQLFNLNETNEVLIDKKMYIITTIPERLNEIKEQIKSIDEEVQIYSKPSWRGFDGIRGSWFRAVHTDLARGSIDFSEEQKQMLEELDLIKLGLKGDKLVDQREIVQSVARKAKSAVPDEIYYLKIDKNSVNIRTLEKYESALNSLQISYDNFQKELEKYNEMEEELKLSWIKVRQIVAAAEWGGGVYIHD